MSLELVNTLATLGTFLVIAATAIAAVVQLRHMRSSNQIVAMNELRETTESPDLQAARHFVRTELSEKIKDPAFRYQVSNRQMMSTENRAAWDQATHAGNFYEGMGQMVKRRLADKELVLDAYAYQVLAVWEALGPITTILRRETGSKLWENLEYLCVLSQDYLAAHPNGTYPPNVRRIELKDEWLEADKQYAASLASA